MFLKKRLRQRKKIILADMAARREMTAIAKEEIARERDRVQKINDIEIERLKTIIDDLEKRLKTIHSHYGEKISVLKNDLRDVSKIREEMDNQRDLFEKRNVQLSLLIEKLAVIRGINDSQLRITNKIEDKHNKIKNSVE